MDYTRKQNKYFLTYFYLLLLISVGMRKDYSSAVKLNTCVARIIHVVILY